MDSQFITRPIIAGIHGVASSSHYLATLAGINILQKGGNAFDAAAAIGLSLAVLEPHMNGLGGEVPILLYSSRDDEVVAVSGQGTAPSRANIDWFTSHGFSLIPGSGLLPAVVPSMVSTWIEVLKRYGTMTFSDVAFFSIELAQEGFPMYYALKHYIEEYKWLLNYWKTSEKVFLIDGRIPEEGEIFAQPQLAKTLKLIAEAEKRKSNREDGLEEARKVFYEGEIAKKIDEFVSKPVRDEEGNEFQGFLSYDDLANYTPKFEKPLKVNFNDYTVFKCSTWTQGAVFLQMLNILSDFDLRNYKLNSSDYIHLLVEAFKLVFYDREKYYGDPEFDEVPINWLLSEGHAKELRNSIDMEKASNVPIIEPSSKGSIFASKQGDTTHFDVIDRWGNMVSATQSGGWFWSSPIVSDLGFSLSTRGQMFYLDKKRNNCLQPRKRPRTTLTPTLVFKDDKPYMVFGTPGGDMQDQWNLQFFLNHVVFGMNIQEAIESPSFHTLHYPSSFYPRKAERMKVVIEGRIERKVVEELKGKGHIIEMTGDWRNGRVTCALRDIKRGVLMASASPKYDKGGPLAYAMGW